MKTLSQHIEEKLIVNKNFDNDTNNILNDIDNIKNDDDLFAVIEKIVASTDHEPDLENDTMSFRTFDTFEQWEDDFGKSDGMYYVIKKYCDDAIVLGWKSDKSFNDVERNMPSFFNDIMDSDDWEYKMVHKKMDCIAELWRKKKTCDTISHLKAGNYYTISLLKLNMHVNYDGKEYMEYWYMFIIE